MAFTQPSLVIDRAGATVEVPAAVGSTLTDRSLASDDPGVVEITPTGNLHALKAGRTIIRSTGDHVQSLQVEVAEVSDLVLVPDAITLQPRGRAELALFDKAQGRMHDPSLAQWFTTAPEVATAIDGRIQAGDATGVAAITATYAGQAIHARVVVVRAKVGPLSIRPLKPRLQVGQAVTFEALQAGTGSGATWTATAVPHVLHQSGPTTFVGSAPGKAKVCADMAAQRTCTEVTVAK